jgi:hypothetical protein
MADFVVSCLFFAVILLLAAARTAASCAERLTSAYLATPMD